MTDSMDDPLTEPAPAALPKPKKKSLFTKSWNKPAKQAEQKEGLEFFSRAEEMWLERIAEEERKRQKKQEKVEKMEQRGRKRSTASAERQRISTPEDKRRRLSKDRPERVSLEGSMRHDDPDEAFWTRRESTLSTPGSHKSERVSRRNAHAFSTSLAGRYSRDLQKNKEASNREVVSKGYVSLSDSDEDFEPKDFGRAKPIGLDEDGEEDEDMVAIRTIPALQIEGGPDMSDEEFPELARQARDSAKQKEVERLKAESASANQNQSTTGSKTPDPAVDDFFQDKALVLEDPRVEIFISSVMIGSKNLIVKRKLSHTLKAPRLVWCDKHVTSGLFDATTRDSIFLTWKGKRVFDSSTCAMLKIKVDGSGQMYSETGGTIDGRIHLEAWTQELFDENQRRLAAGIDTDNEPEPVKEDPVKVIRITLRAQGRDDVKLKVKPTTPLARFITIFREQRGRPGDGNMTLQFDGERLDPEDTVEATDIDDMDIVEVHFSG